MATYKPYRKTDSAGTLEEIKIPVSSVNGIENYQKIGSGICYDTSTSDTAGTWNVTIPNITELTEGLTIKVRLKTSYNSTTNTLNVNGLGAKTVYFRYGTKLTSHYAKESVLALTYTASAIGSGTDTSGWIVENIYDSTNTYQLRVYNTKPKTKSALYRYMICFVNNDGLLIPANNTSNSTATTKTLTTESFNLFDSIYYYNSTTTINANGQVGTGTLYKQLSIDLRYSFNTGTTLVAPNGVYLKVTADGSQFKLATDTPVTQSLPTSDDGYFYCYLGRAYSTYQIELVPEHPIYLYKNGIIQEYRAYIKSVADNAVTKNGDQTIQGAKTFTDVRFPNGIKIGDSNRIYGASDSEVVSQFLPAKDGTFAMTSDIPDVSGKANLSGSNTFTGNNQFGGEVLLSNRFEVDNSGEGQFVVGGGVPGVRIDDVSDGDVPLVVGGNAGTDGQVLTSKGAGVTPQWTSIPTYSLSGTTLTITLP